MEREIYPQMMAGCAKPFRLITAAAAAAAEDSSAMAEFTQLAYSL